MLSVRGWKRAFKIMLTSVTAIVALLLVILVTASIVLAPARLTRMVNKYANEYLNAEVHIGKATLQLLGSLPNACIRLEEGTILSGVFKETPYSLRGEIPSAADTLATFKELYLSISIPSIISGNYVIRDISATGLGAYAFIAPDGRANWEIYSAEETPDEQEDENSGPLQLDIRRIKADDGVDLTFHSQADSLFAHIGLGELLIRGNLSTIPERIAINESDIKAMDARLEIRKTVPNSMTSTLNLDTLHIHTAKGVGTSVTIATRTGLTSNGTVWAENIPISISGKMKRERREGNALQFEDMLFRLGSIPLHFNGKIKITNQAVEIPALHGESTLNLGDLVAKVSDKLFPSFKEFRTNAKLQIAADIWGYYNFETGELPSAKIMAKVPKCSANFGAYGVKWDNVGAEMEADFNSHEPEKSKVTFKNITARGKALEIEGSCSASDYLNDPLLNLNLSASVNADTISRLLPAKFPFKLSGMGEMKFKVNSPVSNLTDMRRVGAAETSFEVKSRFLEFSMPSEQINCRLLGAKAVASTGRRPVDREGKMFDNLLMLDVTTDSTYTSYRDEIELSGRGINVSMKNSAKVLSSEAGNIVPFMLSIGADMLSVKGNGGTVAGMRMKESKNTLFIFPDREKRKNPKIMLQSQCGILALRDADGFYSLRDASFKIRAGIDLMKEAARKARRENMLDSLQRIYPYIERDSLFRHSRKMLFSQGGGRKRNELAEHDLQMRLDRNLVGLVSDLNMSGNIQAKSGRLFTRLMPLPISLNNANVDFNTDSMIVHDTQVHIGESDFKGSGYLAGIKGALTRNTTLEANFEVHSDTLNLSQIMVAIDKGQKYMEEREMWGGAEELTETELEKRIEEAVKPEERLTEESTLFIIPGNLYARFKMNVAYAKYARTIFSHMTCAMKIKERCLQVTDLSAESTSGSIALSAFYATKSKSNIFAGMDMDLKDIKVADFIEMLPSVDTLLPMLRSFDGKVSSQMAFSAKMDNKMNFDLPSMQGSLRIGGDSLVLMDGETFTKISKMARFRNRERNLVDKISVEALMHDGYIELFPFIMTMDRYTAAISGRQNLDMSFNYHISMLKSILPFRFGINLKSNGDNIKFGLGRAKYKSAKLPVYSFIVNSTKLNLRDYIANIFSRGVEYASLVTGGAEEEQAFKELEDTEEIPLTFRDSLFISEPDSTLAKMEGLNPSEQDSLLYTIKLERALTALDEALNDLPKGKARKFRRQMLRTERRMTKDQEKRDKK